jgi:hypothetical protein
VVEQANGPAALVWWKGSRPRRATYLPWALRSGAPPVVAPATVFQGGHYVKRRPPTSLPPDRAARGMPPSLLETGAVGKGPETIHWLTLQEVNIPPPAQMVDHQLYRVSRTR